MFSHKDYTSLKEKEIAILLRVAADDRPELRKLLDEMVSNGVVIRTKKGKFIKPKDMQLIIGDFIGHQKGFGFVVVEDRAVEEGDILTIDYTGSIEGEKFEGGTGENQTLTIGAGEFIPGFEEQLIGKNVGDETVVNVTFPETYHSEDLASKSAVFEVKVHEIKTKELPELDDDFAKDTSEFDTLEELKADVSKNLKEQNEKSAKEVIRNMVVDLAVDNVEMEIPQGMIDSETDFMLKDMEYQLSYSGINMEQYLSITQSTIEDIKEQMKEDAKKRVKTQLVIEKIVEVEAVEVTKEDIDAEIQNISEVQGQSIEEVEKVYGRDDYAYLKDTLKSTKVVDMLEAQAKIVK
jgi:trigger factor